MKHQLQFILFIICTHGFGSEISKEKEETVWMLIEGEETLAWKKQFEAAAKKDQLHQEMEKIGVFSTRGPYFFRNDKKDSVRILFYIGFVGRYEVELKVFPKIVVADTFFRDAAKDAKFKKFRPMYDAFIDDLLKKHGNQGDTKPKPAQQDVTPNR